MAVDYSGQRTVKKNRPKKQGGGIFGIILLGALATAFACGVLTGWFLFKPSKKGASPQAVAAGSGQKNSGAPRAPASQPAAAERSAEPPLTFYETLPKGGRSVVIGTGINPVKQGNVPPAKPGPAPPVQAKEAAQPAAAARTAEPREPDGKGTDGAKGTAPSAVDASGKKAKAGSGKLCVQVASFPDRKGAEELRTKLAAKGLDAYIVESNVPDKGVRFRVRIGRGLEQAEANDALQKVGKGAIIIAE